MLQESVAKYLAAGSPLAVLAAFVAGVATSFTPCVFPLIPIVASYLGSQGERSKWHNFLMALFYVIGMSIVYTALGIIAALTGRLFGNVQSNPYVNLGVGNIFIFLGLVMLEVFRLPIPGFGDGGAGKKHGLFGSLMVGFTSGFIAAPCTAAVFLAILTFVAESRNAVFGGLVMWSFAMGLGFLLIIVGTFTGIVASLPKSGKWMVTIQKIFALAMIGVGEYFLIQAGKLWR